MLTTGMEVSASHMHVLVLTLAACGYGATLECAVMGWKNAVLVAGEALSGRSTSIRGVGLDINWLSQTPPSRVHVSVSQTGGTIATFGRAVFAAFYAKGEAECARAKIATINTLTLN